jgi:hypothetical protein
MSLGRLSATADRRSGVCSLADPPHLLVEEAHSLRWVDAKSDGSPGPRFHVAENLTKVLDRSGVAERPRVDRFYTAHLAQQCLNQVSGLPIVTRHRRICLEQPQAHELEVPGGELLQCSDNAALGQRLDEALDGTSTILLTGSYLVVGLSGDRADQHCAVQNLRQLLRAYQELAEPATHHDDVCVQPSSCRADISKEVTVVGATRCRQGSVQRVHARLAIAEECQSSVRDRG